MAVSEKTKTYFEKLKKEARRLYNLAESTKKKGYDPSDNCEIFLANDLAGRVEGLLKQYGITNIAHRINELNSRSSREVTALKIAEEIIYGKYGKFSEEKGAEIAIRAALAILTEGITAAPLQGIDKVEIKKNDDGSEYLSIYYAGPIRSAGGTEQALTVLVADYVRQLLHLDRYKPTEEESKRYVEEIRLYERYVGRFQYHNSEKEIEKAIKHVPIEISGVPTAQVEVSIHRDLPRIETNKLRGGACRVINDGVIGKAAKLLKIAETVGITGWGWLADFSKGNNKKSGIEYNKPNEKYLEDVVAGRPIFAHPSRVGGFSLRYGRSRNTGLAAIGLNPSTMVILEDFLAIGTQVRTERPGKSGIIMPVNTINGPTVKLFDGSVLKVDSIAVAEQIKSKVKKILSLGDVLIGYGEFLENNHPLLPSSYVEEWWIQEVRSKLEEKFGSKLDKFANKLGIDKERIDKLILNYKIEKPTANEAIRISQELNVPLHPRYTYYWNTISAGDIRLLKKWIMENSVHKIEENNVRCTYDPRIKRILEELRLPHINENNKKILVNAGDIKILQFCLRGSLNSIAHAENGLEAINLMANIKIRNKASTFIGLRMGRPEKAKERKMRPPVHVLFPVGLKGKSKRNVIEAASQKVIKLDLALRICPICKRFTFYKRCPSCKEYTLEVRQCPKCGKKTIEDRCKICNESTVIVKEQEVDLYEELKRACINLGLSTPPKIIKGVKGLTNENKLPEPLEKGILRSRHNVFVYKDGTIRFDMTNAPLTHFKPREIKVKIEKLKELGYSKDINGEELNDQDQIIELKVQDIIIPLEAADYLIKVSKFIDELLVRYYKSEGAYNIKKREDLIGQIVIGLAPHTSAGVIGRIIGFTEAKVCFAHPYWHAAKRRNCDGDEDAILLALDAFLNFSKEYLPEKRGGLMDAPLVITLTIDPSEVDDEVFNMDICKEYPLEFYEKTLEHCSPKEVSKIIEKVEDRLGKNSQYEGLYYTKNTSFIDMGPKVSTYKKLKTMNEKMIAQMKIAEKINAADEKDVAQRLLMHHFLPDLIGNLRAFTTQSVRCTKCNMKYYRPPLSGKCRKCGGKLTLTVHRKNIEKYMKSAKMLVNKYKLSNYYKQRLELVEQELKLLFEKSGQGRQSKIIDFWGMKKDG